MPLDYHIIGSHYVIIYSETSLKCTSTLIYDFTADKMVSPWRQHPHELLKKTASSAGLNKIIVKT